MHKRAFIKNLIGLGIGLSPAFDSLRSAVARVSHRSINEIITDEAFWSLIRADYRLKPDYINLENGYYNIIPQSTLNAFIDHVREVNYQGSHYMRNDQQDNKSRMSALLAELVNCRADELIITRNTTESLDLVISGYDWQKGDEAVMAKQDYGAMLNQFKLMEERYGIINKTISVPNNPQSDDEIVQLYEQAITPRTRLLMVCHMINITGQILPIKKISEMAHRYGVDVMVDGAHCIGHIEVDMQELDCDYYGTSLHKWLSVPLGSGFLYVKKGGAKKLYPLLAAWGKEDDDILKLNHTGTHPVHTDLAIQDAISYYHLIGGEVKEKRLRYLQRYWSDQVRKLDKIVINTPKEMHRSCGIANVGIKGLHPNDMSKILLEKYGIWTVGINGAGVHGCRITPNIYTSIDEMDRFVEALHRLHDS